MTEERGAGHDITLPKSSITTPNIERDKVEEIISWLRHREASCLEMSRAAHPNAAPAKENAKAYADRAATLEHFVSLITVSEKRAETAEQLAEDWQCEYDKVLEERDSLRSSLMRVREERDALMNAMLRDNLRGAEQDAAAIVSALQASGDGGA